MFRTFAPVEHVPQVTNIQFWRESGGTETSERGADSAEVHTRAISDARGRIMVLMTHNTDLGDSWEREGRSRIFLSIFPARLRGRHQRARVHVDSLTWPMTDLFRHVASR